MYVYTNYLPKILINNSMPILFADDTSVITANSNLTGFQKDIEEVSEHLSKCFNINLSSLNFDKTNFVHFKTINTSSLDIKDWFNMTTDLLLIHILPGFLD